MDSGEFRHKYVQEAVSAVPPEERYTSWENAFTDPVKHNPRKFTYVVHGLARSMGRAIQAIDAHDIGADPNKRVNINLEDEPLRIAEKPVISTSVIDRKHRTTWGDTGLILCVPPENIVNVYPGDAGTPWHDPEAAVASQSQDLACTVEELLQQTRPGSYNEVVLRGTTAAGEVKVVGFFIKVFGDNTLVDEEMTRKVSGFARQYNLPLIEILDQSPRISKDEQRRREFSGWQPLDLSNLNLDELDINLDLDSDNKESE